MLPSMAFPEKNRTRDYWPWKLGSSISESSCLSFGDTTNFKRTLNPNWSLVGL